MSNNVTMTSLSFMPSPHFAQLETMFLQRLAPYPEALRAVVEGLETMESSEPVDMVALPVAEGYHAAA